MKRTVGSRCFDYEYYVYTNVSQISGGDSPQTSSYRDTMGLWIQKKNFTKASMDNRKIQRRIQQTNDHRDNYKMILLLRFLNRNIRRLRIYANKVEVSLCRSQFL